MKENSGDKLTRVRAGGRRRLDWQARPKSAVALAAGSCTCVSLTWSPGRRDTDTALLLNNSDATKSLWHVCARFSRS
jgi:hypothetical protein